MYYKDNYAVYIVAADDTAAEDISSQTSAFEEKFTSSTAGSTQTRTVYGIDVSGFAGQEIRIVFRHYDCNAGVGILLYDLSVTENLPAVTPTFTTDLNTNGGTYTVGDTEVTPLTVAASVTDDGTVTYQWYSNTTDSTEGATLLADETGASYTPSTAAVGTTYYYAAAINTLGTSTATTMSQIAAVAVTKKTVQVELAAQNDSAFLVMPQTSTVDSDAAENYGFTDSVSGVSMLDALVCAHEIKYGTSFTQATAAEYLAVDESGIVTIAFGVSTTAFGFAVNGISPNDGVYNETYNAYTGYSIQQAEVEVNDLIEFYFYEDSSWLDQYVWFGQNGTMTDSVLAVAGQARTLNLSGYSIGWYGCSYTSLAEVAADKGGAVGSAQLALVDASTGSLTDIDGAVTDDNGSVSITFPTAGSYLLTAYMPAAAIAENASPVILTLASVTVAESNTAPAIISGVSNPATTTVKLGEAFTLDLETIFEDVNNDPLAYTVSVDGADVVSTDADYSYTPAAEGDTTLVFTASDGVADSESYTVTVTADDMTTLTFKVGPKTDNVTFYATTGYDENGYDLYDETAPLLTVDDGVVSGYHVYTVNIPVEFTTVSFRGTDANGNDLGGMSVDVDDASDGVITLRQFEGYISTKIDDTCLTADQGVFEIKDADNMSATSGSSYVNSSGYTRFRFLLYAGGNAELYSYYAVPQGDLAQTYGTNIGLNKTISAGISVTSKNLTLPLLYSYTITTPTAASVQVFNQLRNYYTVEIDETSSTDNDDGTTSHVFRLPGGNSNLTYRVSMNGYITKAGYLSSLSADGSKTIEWSESDASPTTRENDVTSSIASYVEESLLLNVNSQNYLELETGDTYRLRAYRIWQIINSLTANVMIEPDFSYTVISGSDVVSIDTVTDGNGNASGNWLDITAVSEGTAIIELSYDAIDISGGYSGTYAASDPQRTGLLVIHVGSNGTVDIDFGIDTWDAEYDTVYFNGDSGIFSLSPSADGGITSVEVLNNPATNSTWTTLTAAEGVYTATITPGNNILRITSGDTVEYQVVRGASITTVIENATASGETIETGDEIDVSFDGLYIPIPKFSGIYNPGYGSGGGHTITYTLDEGVTLESTQSVQYNFISNHTLTLSCEAAGTYELTDGYIAFTVMGVSDPLGGHRVLTDTGISANFSAVRTSHTRSIMPDVTITVDEPESCYETLSNLITTSKTELGSVMTSTNGSDVSTSKYWVTSAEYATFLAAITAAEAYTEENSDEVLQAAITTLQTALDTFEDAQSLGTASGNSSSSPIETEDIEFDISSSEIDGYVTISFEDYGIRVDENSDYATGLGTIVSAAEVPYAEGESIAEVTIRLLDALDIGYTYTGSTTSSFYLALIKDFALANGDYIEILGECTNGCDSGWMITWNNWFINMGASEFAVEDGDIIEWQYTCQLGADIGCDWNNPSAEITGINFKTNYGTLSPAFSKDETAYIYTIPSSVKSICLEALQENYWAIMTYTCDDTTYKPMESIPVSNGTVIQLDCAFAEYYGDTPTDTDSLTITIQVEGEAAVTASGSSSDSEATTKLTPDVSVTDGTASASVSRSEIDDALEASEEDVTTNITITATTDETVTKSNVTLPSGSASDIVEAGLSLTIEMSNGTFDIDNAALGTIAGAGSGKIEIIIEQIDTDELSDNNKAIVGNHPVFDLSITVGGTQVTGFGDGTVTVSLPYTPADGEDTDNLTVYYINDSGSAVKMEGAYYDASSGCVIFETSHFSTFAIVCDAVDFDDVSISDWYYDAVVFAVTNGLFSGTSTTRFSPDADMTRAMLVTVLYRLEGEPTVTGGSAFDDVTDGQWYTDAVIWAGDSGIVSGYGSGLFGTNDSVTREQMAAILYNYAAYKGYDVTATSDFAAFNDADDISSWAETAMSWANGEGLITGVTDTTLDPAGGATRAQVATILMRFVQSVVG